jgi:ATP-dependent Lon protease
LKEKLLAARRGGIKTVVIPKENERDLKEVPDNILENLDIKPVKWIDEVLAIALERVPDPISDEEYLADDLIGQANTDSGEPSRPPAH